MEKLTEYVDGKYIRIKGTKSLYERYERDGAPLSNAIVRLAAYEETGLEPEDMKRAFNEDAILKLAGQALGMSPDRLRELVQAKKKGRLVVLPCDVGDKLYDVTLGEVREKIVVSLSMFVPESVNHLVIHAENFRNAVTSYELQDIGKTVFLTREAAEAALEERECTK